MFGGVWFGAPYFGQGPLGGVAPAINVLSDAAITTVTDDSAIRTVDDGDIRTVDVV